jgi:predicted Fe-Mo cluster-binding NifX family protein
LTSEEKNQYIKKREQKIENSKNMKIAVSSDGPNLDAKVANRFSTAQYLLIIDLDTGEYEAIPNPFTTGQPGAGVQAIVLAVSRGANAVLTGYTSPAVVNQFKSSGIKVLTGITGTIRDAIAKYKAISSLKAAETRTEPRAALINNSILIHATRSAARQLINLLPILIGVVLLIGLFNAFISEEWLTSIFSGNLALDTLWGACFGSILAGNPINSYIVGGELLKYGVSLFAVTAFIVTWVTVGLVQLPAEIAAFGKRFAFLRNGFSFVLAIPIAVLTVMIVNFLGRWIS